MMLRSVVERSISMSVVRRSIFIARRSISTEEVLVEASSEKSGGLIFVWVIASRAALLLTTIKC